MDESNAIERACAAVGGQSKLARLVKVTPQAVSLWLKNGVTAERAIQIEQATGGAVTRHDLRPDLYPIAHHPSPFAASKETAA